MDTRGSPPSQSLNEQDTISEINNNVHVSPTKEDGTPVSSNEFDVHRAQMQQMMLQRHRSHPIPNQHIPNFPTPGTAPGHTEPGAQKSLGGRGEYIAPMILLPAQHQAFAPFPAPQLPSVPVWTRHLAPDGRAFFFNKATGERVWDRTAEAGSTGIPNGPSAALHAAVSPNVPTPFPIAASNPAQISPVVVNPSAVASSGALSHSSSSIPGNSASQSSSPSVPTGGVSETVCEWREAIAPNGKTYYYHIKTRETKWIVPDDIKLAISRQNETSATSQLIRKREEAESVVESSQQKEEKEKEKEKEAAAEEEEPQPVAKKLRIDPDTMEDGEMYDPTVTEGEVATDPETIEKEFYALLKEHEVTAYSLWEKVLPKILYDRRFIAVKNPKQARKFFDNYVKTSVQRELAEKKELIEAEQEYRKLLEESDLHGTSTWTKFKGKYRDDPRMIRMKSEANAEKAFRKFVKELSLKETKDKESNAEKKKEKFLELLNESKYITSKTKYYEVKRKLSNDKRYDTLTSRERELVFEEYVESLKAQAQVNQKARYQDREHEKRRQIEKKNIDREREKLQRQQAKEELLCLYQEKIKTSSISWDDVQSLLKEKPRFSTNVLDQDTKKKLFQKHVDDINQRKLVDFKSLLKEKSELFNLNSKYEDLPDSIKSDSRYEAIERERDRVAAFNSFADDLLAIAEKSFRSLLRDGVRSVTLHTKGPAFEGAIELVKNDPRWKALDQRPEKRNEILEEYKRTGGKI